MRRVSGNHDASAFSVPLNDLQVRFGRLRALPWIVFVLLLVSIFAQIVVNGFVEQHSWLDALAIGTVIGLPISLVAGMAATRWFSARDADAFARQVLSLGGVTVTRAEAATLMSHARRISTHGMGRDVREPPPEYEVPLSTELSTSLRLTWAHSGGYHMTVVVPPTNANRAGDGCETCRTGWNRTGTIPDELGVSPHLQTYVYRRATCGTYWESVFGSYPRPISAHQADQLRSTSDFEPY